MIHYPYLPSYIRPFILDLKVTQNQSKHHNHLFTLCIILAGKGGISNCVREEFKELQI